MFRDWQARRAGTVILFSMETEKGQRGFDRVDGYTGRGGAAFVIRHTPEGDQIVLRHGPRTMPVMYTHLMPATFGGKARMNVANALAAAAAAWASGAHLHDIRQGLRTFTTSFFQAPGRLNYLEVRGVRVVIDYCHNVDGMRNLADFARRMNSDGSGNGSGPRRTGDRRHRHARRPPRRGHARVRCAGARRIRRDHRSRGPQPAWAQAWRDRDERRRRRARGARERGPA